MPKETKKILETEARVTTDHEVIKKWVESRGGRPASVKRAHEKNELGIIRVDFPGFTGAGSLEPITWKEFFEQFDDRKLAFLYQERTASGEVSRFNKLISRDSVDIRGRKAA